jgi:hypothetical protein
VIKTFSNQIDYDLNMGCKKGRMIGVSMRRSNLCFCVLSQILQMALMVHMCSLGNNATALAGTPEQNIQRSTRNSQLSTPELSLSSFVER